MHHNGMWSAHKSNRHTYRSWPSPERAVSQSHFQQGQLGVGAPWGQLMGALVQFDGQAALQASPLGMESAAQHGCYHLRVLLRPIAVLARPHSWSKSQYNKLIGCNHVTIHIRDKKVPWCVS